MPPEDISTALFVNQLDAQFVVKRKVNRGFFSQKLLAN
jgi:hypothetical protein